MSSVSGLEQAARGFRNSLLSVTRDRDLNVTSEIAAEINGIITGLDSLKLDQMFLNNSYEWQSRFNPHSLAHDQYNLQELLAQGEAIIYELRSNLNKSNMASMQENQVANVNYLAKQRLRAFLTQLHPYTYNSYVRLDNYAHSLGIKDRFTSIRNELIDKNQINRPGPLRNWTNWTDKELIEAPKYNTPNYRDYKCGFTHYPTGADRRYENKASSTNKNASGYFFQSTPKYFFPLYSQQNGSSAQLNINNSTGNYDEQIIELNNSSRVRPKTCIGGGRVDEQALYNTTSGQSEQKDWRDHAREAGINLSFPGSTEQKDRYTKPPRSDYSNFTINPSMDMSRVNRPFTAAAVYPQSTEYQSRYKMPDGNLIEKFPWKRPIH